MCLWTVAVRYICFARTKAMNENTQVLYTKNTVVVMMQNKVPKTSSLRYGACNEQVAQRR